MDKIRIGNDLIVNWNITRIGKPEDLESKKLKLFLRTGFDKMEISEYIVKDNPFWKELDLSNVYRYSHESFIKTMLCLSYDREKAGFNRMTIYVNRDVFLNLTGEEISSIQARGYDLILKK